MDINDIRAIAMNRNQPAAHPDDPMDWDRNNVINVLDARGCQRVCALPRCRVQAEEPEELEGGVTEVAQCHQTDDIDGDGASDVVVISEHTGKQSANGEIQQHLSTQPAGEVNLSPGTLTIDNPAIVSYRDGEPRVIYYYVDGVLARAFYGIDD